jgi:hypothetical protein
MNTTIIIILGFLILIVVAGIIVVLAKGKDSDKTKGSGKMTFKETDEEKTEDVKPPEKFSPQLHPKESSPVQPKTAPKPMTENKPSIQETIASNPTSGPSTDSSKKAPIDNLSKPLKQNPPQQKMPTNIGTEEKTNQTPVQHPIDSLSPSLKQADEALIDSTTTQSSPVTQKPPMPKINDSTSFSQNTTTPVQTTNTPQDRPTVPNIPKPPVQPNIGNSDQVDSINPPQNPQGGVFKPNPLPSEDKMQNDMNNLNTASNNPVMTKPQSRTDIGDVGVQDIANSINGTTEIPNPATTSAMENTPVNPPVQQQSPPIDSNVNQGPPVKPPQQPQNPPQQNPVNFP